MSFKIATITFLFNFHK